MFELLLHLEVSVMFSWLPEFRASSTCHELPLCREHLLQSRHCTCEIGISCELEDLYSF